MSVVFMVSEVGVQHFRVPTHRVAVNGHDPRPICSNPILEPLQEPKIGGLFAPAGLAVCQCDILPLWVLRQNSTESLAADYHSRHLTRLSSSPMNRTRLPHCVSSLVSHQEHMSMGQAFHPPTQLSPHQCAVRALTPTLAVYPLHVCHRQGTGL